MNDLTVSDLTVSDLTVNDPASNALVSAGAVLPGTSDAGGDRDTITARHYHHPALDGRVVVRLTPAVLGRAEDLTCEYLGFDAPTRTEGVGTGKRSALGFPAWALVHDPANAHHALNLVKDIERLARTAKSRAGAAKDGFTALADMLGRSAPHFLPTFYEQAGRIFLQHGNTAYAASMFGKAREAEEVHDLVVDPERTREVFLEFAFAGALTAKALSAHAKSLTRKHDPDGAYELFLTLCVERTRGGLPPYTGMPEDLRRLAKAAKRKVPAEDARLLRAVLDSAAISRAGAAFWKAYRDSLVALAADDVEVRGRLLQFVPDADAALDTWLDILTASGATRALVGPDEVRVEPAQWLSTVLAVRRAGWHVARRSASLLALVDAMADRLVADGVPVRALGYPRQGELDLLDLLVERGVPIEAADIGNPNFDVKGWLSDDGPGHRDLAALAASERFGRALGEGFVKYVRTATRSRTAGSDVLVAAMAVPGLRVALRSWITATAAEVAATGLPDLARHLAVLDVVRLPEAFVDVPEAAESIAATDVAAALHSTLRAGLLDELGWPALDEAVARLRSAGGPGDEQVVVCGEGWPALVLRRAETFVVVGPDGVLAEHVSRIPADARNHRIDPIASWFDGVLLVRWPGPDGELAYWSDAPDRVFPVDQGDRRYSYFHREIPHASIALPGGGRFTGGRAVHPGDTVVPTRQDAHGDGTTVWTQTSRDQVRWFEVDPATGGLGRASLPRFVEDFAADGTTLVLNRCDLRPALPETEGSPLGAAGGLHGWRVRREADGSWTGEGVDGRRARLREGSSSPTGVLRLPAGAELIVAGGSESMALHDANGTAVATVKGAAQHPPYATGTPLVPPLAWWHLLRPRDEAGSAALRGVTREAVDAMLAAALAKQPDERTVSERLAALARGERDDLARAVTTALPGLTDPALTVGVVDVVRRAAALLRAYGEYAGIAAAAREADVAAPTGPVITENEVAAALGWFGAYRSHYADGSTSTTLPELIATLGETAGQAAPAGRELPESNVPGWFDVLPDLAALAHRAASPLTPDDERAVLALVLRSVADAGLADGDGRWRTVAVVVPEGEASPKGRVVPVRDGFLALFDHQWRRNPGPRFEGLQFSRTPGTFDLPKGWRLSFGEEVRTPFGRERIARFLDLLAEHGPAPWFPEAVPALVERTGLGTAEATVLLAGMPGVRHWGANYLDAADRKLLGLSAGAAKAAKERLKGLTADHCRNLLAAAVPADPAELWTRGPDVAALAEAWIAAHGRRSPVPDDVLVDAAKLLQVRSTAEYVTGLVDPDRTPWLTTDSDLTFTGTALQGRTPDGFGSSALWAVPQVLLWLAHRLPAGSPLRARLPRALSLARQRVAHPGFAVDLGRWVALDRVCALLGVDVPAEGVVHRYRGWLELARVGEESCRLVARPGLVGPGDRDLLVALAEVAGGQDVLRMLDRLADDRLTAVCAVPAPEGVDPAAYHQDPTVSVPALVTEVAARFGLTEDAAALYLQLLALPDPTDANAARWTGWKPARLKRARAALAETDLVLTAKRARAGRSLFLPGGWLALSAPHVPLETWKAPMFEYTPGRPGAIVPLEPVADLFGRAWRRVLDGDAPAYEELKTGGRR